MIRHSSAGGPLEGDNSVVLFYMGSVRCCGCCYATAAVAAAVAAANLFQIQGKSFRIKRACTIVSFDLQNCLKHRGPFGMILASFCPL